MARSDERRRLMLQTTSSFAASPLNASFARRSSTGLSLRPGPYAQLCTYTTPSTVVAGTSLNVTIMAKDYLGAVWTVDSARNFDFKAFGTAKSGAALTFTGNVAQSVSSTGEYRGWALFQESGSYAVRITEGPGKQKVGETRG